MYKKNLKPVLALYTLGLLPTTALPLTLQKSQYGSAFELASFQYTSHNDREMVVARFSAIPSGTIPPLFSGHSVCMERKQEDLHLYMPGVLAGIDIVLRALPCQSHSQNRKGWWPFALIHTSPQNLTKKKDPAGTFVINPFGHKVAEHIARAMNNQPLKQPAQVRMTYTAPNIPFSEFRLEWDIRASSSFALVKPDQPDHKRQMAPEQFNEAVYQLKRNKHYEYFGWTVEVLLSNRADHQLYECCDTECPDFSQMPVAPTEQDQASELINVGNQALLDHKLSQAYEAFGEAAYHFGHPIARDSFEKMLSIFPSTFFPQASQAREWLKQHFNSKLTHTDIILTLWRGSPKEQASLKKYLKTLHTHRARETFKRLAYFLSAVIGDSHSSIESSGWLRSQLNIKTEF